MCTGINIVVPTYNVGGVFFFPSSPCECTRSHVRVVENHCCSGFKPSVPYYCSFLLSGRDRRRRRSSEFIREQLILRCRLRPGVHVNTARSCTVQLIRSAPGRTRVEITVVRVIIITVVTCWRRRKDLPTGRSVTYYVVLTDILSDNNVTRWKLLVAWFFAKNDNVWNNRITILTFIYVWQIRLGSKM